MKKAPLVFGIGQCSLDHLGLVAVYPPPDVKCEFTNLILQGGGPAATALVALKRWGARCHIAGVLGDDGFGTQIKALLDDEGIDTSGLQIRKKHQSQFAFIASEPALARRFTRCPQENRPAGEINTASACEPHTHRRRFTEARFSPQGKGSGFRHWDAGTARRHAGDGENERLLCHIGSIQRFCRNTRRNLPQTHRRVCGWPVSRWARRGT